MTIAFALATAAAAVLAVASLPYWLGIWLGRLLKR